MSLEKCRVFTVMLMTALFLAPVPAQAESWQWLPLDRNTALIFGSAAFDYTSTKIAERRGYLEANPIVGTNPYQQVGVMLGSAWLSATLSNHLERRGHTKLAQVVRTFKIGLHVGAGVHNLTQTRGR